MPKQKPKIIKLKDESQQQTNLSKSSPEKPVKEKKNWFARLRNKKEDVTSEIPDVQGLDDLKRLKDVPQDKKQDLINEIDNKKDDALRQPRELLDKLKLSNLGFDLKKLKLALIIGLAVLLVLALVFIAFYLGTQLNSSTYTPPTVPIPIDLTDPALTGSAVPVPLDLGVSEEEKIDGFIWPVQNTARVTSCFGQRTLLGGLSNHKGLDIGLVQGTPVIASARGQVEYFEISNLRFGYGTYVVLLHDNGMRTLYGHLQAKLSLQRGQILEQGATLGLSGNTGYSTGPHLHFEIINQDGVKVDPALHIKTRVGSTLFKTGDDKCWVTAILGQN